MSQKEISRRSFIGKTAAVESGKAEMITCEEYGNRLPYWSASDNSKWHLDNWIDCMRDRNPDINGHIHTGFWHSVGVVMATRAYREGKKMYWDREKEEVVDSPPHLR